ncbi:hypothetical protein GCM10008968_15260 [Bacillus horti]
MFVSNTTIDLKIFQAKCKQYPIFKSYLYGFTHTSRMDSKKSGSRIWCKSIKHIHTNNV